MAAPRKQTPRAAVTAAPSAQDDDNVKVITTMAGDIDLDALIEQRAESLGLRDGTMLGFTFQQEHFEFPHPMFAEDEWLRELDAVTDTDPISVGQFLLGDQYDRFIELGGKPQTINLVLEEAQRKSQATDVDGNPTRFSRSSRQMRRRPR